MAKKVKPLKIDEPENPDYSDIGIFRPKIIDEALLQFNESANYWRPKYKIAARDKSFLQTKQWDSKTTTERSKVGKLSMTAPLIASFFREKMGQLLPGDIDVGLINLDPRPETGVDSSNVHANDESIARVLTGAIRYVDRNSKAKAHRNQARKEQCAGGIGWFSLAFADDSGVSDGSVVIKTPKETSSVYIDPWPEQPDYSDARYSFQIFPMSWPELKGKYGSKVTKIKKRQVVDGQLNISDVISMDDFSPLYNYLESTTDGIHGNSKFMNNWFDKNKKEVNVAVWYRRVATEKTFVLLSDGREIEKELIGTLEDDVTVIDERKETGWKVERRVLTGWTVLEEDLDYFIDEIPHVPVLGYTISSSADTTYHSIIHDGVELQEKINLLMSNGVEKASKAKATALVPHGVLPDKIKKLATVNNVDVIGVDVTSDGSGGGGFQLIQNPDNGSIEFSQIQPLIAMLKQVCGVNDNDNRGSINSAAQLQLTLEQEVVRFNELDDNYKMALTALYRKILKAIINTTSADEYMKIINPDSDEDVVIAEKLSGDISVLKYDVSIKVGQTAQVQRRKEQIFLEAMANPQDPILRTSVIPELINSSPVRQKERTLDNWARNMVAAGQQQFLSPELFAGALEQLQQSGQLQQIIEQRAAEMAQTLSQQQLTQLLQDSSAQAIIARSQADVAKAEAQTVQATTGLRQSAISAQRDIQKDALQVTQQQEQTKQDALRTEQERIELRTKLVGLQTALANADAKQIDHLNRVLKQADLVTVTI